MAEMVGQMDACQHAPWGIDDRDGMGRSVTYASTLTSERFDPGGVNTPYQGTDVQVIIGSVGSACIDRFECVG